MSGAHALITPVLAMLAWIDAPSCGADAVESPPGSPGMLTASAPMVVGRALHSATRLMDGRVLVVGGGTPGTAIARAEIFDPATGIARAIAMSTGRLGHTATLLPNGTVLVIGGGYGSDPALRTAELFDPATDTFRSTGAPVEPRTDHAAVLLRSGKVLVLGGDASGVGAAPTATAELYDPATGQFTSTGSMLAPRRPYGVVLMADGTVLVPGGTSADKSVVASAEVYDPASARFTRTGALLAAREKHTAALLRDGTVLVIGGSNETNGSGRLTSSEVYDPRTKTFSAGPALHGSRHKIVSIALGNGSVLVAGGGRDLAELYDPATKRFNVIGGASDTERFFPAVTAMGDDRVWISGGYTSGGAQRGTWMFQP